nr:hypothetical protein [Tanacetum cinerariifolium]
PFHTKKLFTTLRVNSPSFSGRTVPLFDTMLIHHGEGSGTPTEPHPTPSQEAQPSSPTHISSPYIPTIIHIPIVTQGKPTPPRQYTRRARIAQSSTLPPVADEPASPVRDDSQGEAYPTDSGFIANQDRATIAMSSTLPHDSAPQVTSPAAEEGSMQQTINELTALCTSLQRQHSELLVQFQAQEVEINQLKERVKILEDNQGVIGARSGDDAPIKGKRIDEEEITTERLSSDTGEVRLDEREVATERTSDDTEEMAIVLTTMDAATVLASKAAKIPTGSGSIPTAGAEVSTGSNVVPTASPVFATATVVTPYRRRKGKEVMVESETPKKQKVQEQIDAQSMIESLDSNNKIVAKYLEEYRQFSSELPMERRIEMISDLVKYQDNYTKVYKFQSQQRKSWTKKQKRDYYLAVIRNNLGWKVKDFKGMTFKDVEAKFNSVYKQMEDFIPMGSKEEAERIKRKGINLEQESAKKQNSSEEITKEAKSPEEVHNEGQRAYWKITRLGGSSASYQFFTDLLKHLDREDLNQLWTLVKETLSSRSPTSDKEMELWVELSRLYKPDEDDQLWTHTQNLMHAPVEWKLYESCGVHHVAAKDNEIFMLVEKDYPLRKGLTLVMISYKL